MPGINLPHLQQTRRFLADSCRAWQPITLIIGICFLGVSLSLGETPANPAVNPTRIANPKSGSANSPPFASKLSFSRDIRPLLSNACFACHGVDATTRKAGLRLDLAESALAPADSGAPAIVPGNPDDSELIRRILTDDPAEVMPPPASNKTLTAAEKDRLKRWISEGATYESHWSFTAPRRPPLPPVSAARAAWPRNEIDQFVLARLEAEHLEPSAEASRSTLLRRVSLDITGLPPTLDETRAFLGDESPQAYEKLVDRLLASPAYGERLAQLWLDLARYADTNGYNNDEERTMWLWREWIIDSFNANLPFDQFIVEQIAGDLLPEATPEQRVATGFNRNHVITTEGGIIPEEYRLEYVADRVHTTSTVFLGLSLQCARCHEHKYDPFSQADYYRLFAFFNNVADKTVGYNSGAPAEPYLKAVPHRWKQDNERLLGRTRQLADQVAERERGAAGRITQWEASVAPANLPEFPELPEICFSFDEGAGTTASSLTVDQQAAEVKGTPKWSAGKTGQSFEFDGQTHLDAGQFGGRERDQSFTLTAWIFPTSNEALTIASKMNEAEGSRGYDLILESGRLAAHLIHAWPDNGLKVISKTPLSLNAWHHVAAVYDGSSTAAGVKLYVDGSPQELDVASDKLSETILTEQPFRIGSRKTTANFKGRIDDLLLFGAALPPAGIADLAAGRSSEAMARHVLSLAPELRTAVQDQFLRGYYFARVDAEYQQLVTQRHEADQALAAFDRAVPATMIMQELPEVRETFILRRGQYDQPGEKVTAAVPGSLPALPEGVPSNRLGLARWLVDRQNPLTARVMVNRFWQQLFGTGIVETVEDFGLQGAYPTHPELLDWLAVDFQENGWNLKRLLRQIVLSATYRQSSAESPQQLERDPRNLLLGRGTRMRLPAEMLRDNALALAGLLTFRIGGPSVKPYQPAGLWQDVSVERRAIYEPSKGGDLYRRSLYTYWKRTCPPPGMTSFDAPDRETCTIRRARTNTPLQALVLLNDPTYVEAARNLAEQVLLAGPLSDAERIDLAWMTAVSRSPRQAETAAILPIVEAARQQYRSAPEEALKLISVGDSPREPMVDAADLAAWTTAVAVLLNLDETISRE